MTKMAQPQPLVFLPPTLLKLSTRLWLRYARRMSRLSLRHLRRCRLLFVLALCAWLGLAGSVFARTADCCAGMAGTSTQMHQHGTPVPLHADACHLDCACAHAVVTLPVLLTPMMPSTFVAVPAHAVPTSAPDHPHAPPLRPPLA